MHMNSRRLGPADEVEHVDETADERLEISRHRIVCHHLCAEGVRGRHDVLSAVGRQPDGENGLP